MKIRWAEEHTVTGIVVNVWWHRRNSKLILLLYDANINKSFLSIPNPNANYKPNTVLWNTKKLRNMSYAWSSLTTLWNVGTLVCMCIFSLFATMNEVSCYHPGICSFLSNHSFCSSLHRPGIDLREEGSRYTWGQGHLIATWEKNDVGPSREISNRAIRRTKGIETKTEGTLHSLISLITFFILWSGCFRLIFWGD